MKTSSRGCRGGYTLLCLQAVIKKRRIVIADKGRNRCVDQVFVEERVDTDPELVNVTS